MQLGLQASVTNVNFLFTKNYASVNPVNRLLQISTTSKPRIRCNSPRLAASHDNAASPKAD